VQAHCSIGTVPAGQVQTAFWQTGDFATSVHGAEPPLAGPLVTTQLGIGVPHAPAPPLSEQPKRVKANQTPRIA